MDLSTAYARTNTMGSFVSRNYSECVIDGNPAIYDILLCLYSKNFISKEEYDLYISMSCNSYEYPYNLPNVVIVLTICEQLFIKNFKEYEPYG